jgi:Family of unknown function (DUF5372)
MGRLSRTKYNLRNVPERVTITRAHHPLHDQVFEVLRGGNERITIRLADGTSMHVSRSWTDADGMKAPAARRRGSFFTSDSLRRLFLLLDGLLSRDESLRLSPPAGEIGLLKEEAHDAQGPTRVAARGQREEPEALGDTIA